MEISKIKEFPSTIGTGKNGERYHESILRSYQILEKTKELLELNTPPSVVLEIIHDIEKTLQIDKEV